MGLGLHGGGIETARYLAAHGAEVTVTDLRDESVLEPSIRALDGIGIRFVLGRHEARDFSDADAVVKNPAVRRNNPFLLSAKQVWTDISLFLDRYPGPILAVTGSKGKSSTASALAHGLKTEYPAARLGGNITVTPLSFVDAIDDPEHTPVVLELSSFQLGDLALAGCKLNARACGITNILRDHQDYYTDMDSYVRDKELVFRNQNGGDCVFFADQRNWTERFLGIRSARGDFGETDRIPGGPVWLAASSPAALESFGVPHGAGTAWIEDGRGFMLPPLSEGESSPRPREIVPDAIAVPGMHQKINLLFAGVMMHCMGISDERIAASAASYPGIPHRLEYCGEIGGVRIFNDSAATIPEAVLSAAESFAVPVHLICGGTDKNLDFSPITAAARTARSVTLLDGSASAGMREALTAAGIGEPIPHPDLDSALAAALERTRPGEVLVFSPGCASFGMFRNEFDRGNRFKAAVCSLSTRPRDTE